MKQHQHIQELHAQFHDSLLKKIRATFQRIFKELVLIFKLGCDQLNDGIANTNTKETMDIHILDPHKDLREKMSLDF